jgi:hypothetical protein
MQHLESRVPGSREKYQIKKNTILNLHDDYEFLIIKI